jgi:hypothetical protein
MSRDTVPLTVKIRIHHQSLVRRLSVFACLMYCIIISQEPTETGQLALSRSVSSSGGHRSAAGQTDSGNRFLFTVRKIRVSKRCSPSTRSEYLGLLLNWSDCTLQRHNTENSKQIFPEKEFSPNFHIYVSVRDFFPTIGLPILLQENM